MLRKIVKLVVSNSWLVGNKTILCVLAGVFTALPFANGRLWVFSWFGFVPLFAALRNNTKFKSFLFSYFTGVIFWACTIYWLIHVTLPGTIILVLYLALYFGVFGLLVFTTSHELRATSLLFIPSLWVLLEYLRSYLLTGFPWAILGYGQYLNLPVIQIADITGAWGVSFLVMMANVAIYIMVTKFRGRSWRATGAAILAVLVVLIYGYYKLGRQISSIGHRTVKISVIQGNIPQERKWDAYSRDFIIDRYIELTRQAAKDNPDLIIWPEAALPVIPQLYPSYYERAQASAKEINTPLLLGAVTLRENHYHNSAILISKDGMTLNFYDKLHLVPFGEYTPLKEFFSFLEAIVPIGEMTPGRERTVFTSPARFSVLICFEDLFPELSRNFVNGGAEFLVNITNDAWYKKTDAPYQHLQASVLRAVENRLFLVRAANTGISSFIAPTGEITSSVRDGRGTEIFVSGYRTQRILAGKGPLSFYGRHGDIFIFILPVFLIYGIFRSKKHAL
ncbi:MAG: apolipoprotein N-acyltransferase [Deltaproteobacteria bacterium]